jgi:hypothetical protein
MYNNYPIKNVNLVNTNIYSQLDSSGVVVYDASGSITMNTKSITTLFGTTTFNYAPLNIVPVIPNSTIPADVPLPYQQYLLVNPNATPITYLVPSGNTLYWNGTNRSSVTLNARGQNITLGITGGTSNYIVISVGGTVGNGGNNIVFNT